MTETEAGQKEFSYTDNYQTPIQRSLIELIEIITGKAKLHKLYQSLDPASDLNIWAQIIKVLDIRLKYDQNSLENIPTQGPLVVVANHPFGVVDGIIICYLTSLVRGENFRILTNNALCAIPGVEEYFLPIEFAMNREAQAINLETRKRALEYLKAGNTIIIFPGGAVSHARHVLGEAEDPEWNPFTSKMILKSGAQVAPFFFEGQNSRAFQIASHISQSLRLSLLMGEINNKIGKVQEVQIGNLLKAEELESFESRKELMAFLRGTTYALRKSPKSKRQKIIEKIDETLEKVVRKKKKKKDTDKKSKSGNGKTKKDKKEKKSSKA